MSIEKILVRRGLESELTPGLLDVGEMGLTTDSTKVFIGTGAGNLQIYPVAGSGGGGSTSLAMQDFKYGNAVQLSQPLDARSVFVSKYDKTSITLSWSPSLSTGVQDYTIYNGGILLGNTTGTTFQATGLTSATNYTLTVKTRSSGNVESNGIDVVTKTAGNFALSLNKQWIECPNLTFSMVEMHMIVTPKASSWNNVFVDSNSTNLKITTQFDGLRPIDTNLDIWVDGVKYVTNQFPPLSVDKYYQMLSGNYDYRTTTDKLYLLGFKNGAVTDMIATVYQVKFWTVNKLNQYDLVADYDCTYNPGSTNIPDRLGVNPPLILHGGTFIAN
jgi:hypothetical protein